MKIKLTIALSSVRKRVLTSIMKTFIFLFYTTVFSFNVEGVFSQEKVKIDRDQLATVGQVFKIIKNQTNYDFIYSKRLFKDTPKIQLKKGKILITELLKKSLLSKNIDFELSNGNIVIIKSETVLKNIKTEENQGIQVSGNVLDASGIPLAGANILEKGTSNGSQTDFDGNFSLTVADGNAVLIVSYLGFTTKEILVNNQNQITIVLDEDTATLDEVVLVGYGTQKKSDLTGSVASISEEDLQIRPVPSFQDALQGRASGINVRQTGGDLTGDFAISIRGVGSVTGS